VAEATAVAPKVSVQAASRDGAVTAAYAAARLLVNVPPSTALFLPIRFIGNNKTLIAMSAA
jgi:hypothetical protein